MRRLAIVFIVLVCSEQIDAATWYVRPATDGSGTDLNYGTEDGSSWDNAFDGFSGMSGLSSGDTVCLPGSEEPFFERLNTSTAGVTYAGCDSTPAILWSAQGLSGNRSFNSSRAAVSTGDYAWASDGNGLYHKRIDVRAQMLWEDDTWLQPVNIDAGGETSLIAGQWGMKDTGGGTYAIYYRASSGGGPTINTIRCDDVTTSDNPLASRDMRVDVDNTTVRNVEVRGHRGRAIGILDASNILLDEVSVTRSTVGVWISADTVAVRNIELRNVSVTGIELTGAYIQGGAQGVTNLRINGGSYNGASGTSYNGKNFTGGDGDGIGIGQGGGNITDLHIRGITANDNRNAGVFLGTSEAMTVTNFSLVGAVMLRNGVNCFAEGSTVARATGQVIIAGFLCGGTLNTTSGSSMRFAIPESPRTVTIANGTFIGNYSAARISFKPHADNNYIFRNLIFADNPGAKSGNLGDLSSFSLDLIGDEVFDHLYFYSTPGEAKRLATLGVALTPYLYNTESVMTDFNSATGATSSVMSDPELNSSGHPLPSSPVRHTGATGSLCADARGRVCPPDRPNIGAYQSTSGDPAATRAVRN